MVIYEMEGEIKVGMKIIGGEDFCVERTVEKRLGRHLWQVYCYESESGRAFRVKMTTKELQNLIEKFGAEE